MATHVTVQSVGSLRGLMGEVVGFATSISRAGHSSEKVLVALEDGRLKTFAPSALRAGKVVYNRRPE